MLLLLPGPVTTHPTVRAAASQDLAPWDNEMRAMIADVLDRLRSIAGGSLDAHAAQLLPGAGHFMVEAAIRTFVLPETERGNGTGGGILIPETGQYADRMIRLAHGAGRRVTLLPGSLVEPVDPAAVEAALLADPTISHLGLVYSETSTGIVHDLTAVGAVVRRLGRRMILDAISAFGALPINLAAHPEIDALVLTPNKCLESLPGLSVSVCPITRLQECSGKAESWAFDLGDLYNNALLNEPGFSRFAPPIQALAALAVALDRLEAEGGPSARLRRYQDNMATLRAGIVDLGLRPVLKDSVQGPIVMNVLAPDLSHWDLQQFVDALKKRGVLISNFCNTEAPSIRLGAIGAIGRTEILKALGDISDTLAFLGLPSAKSTAWTEAS